MATHIQPIFVETIAAHAEDGNASLHFRRLEGNELCLMMTEAELQKLYWHIVHEVQQGRAHFALAKETP